MLKKSSLEEEIIFFVVSGILRKIVSIKNITKCKKIMLIVDLWSSTETTKKLYKTTMNIIRKNSI